MFFCKMFPEIKDSFDHYFSQENHKYYLEHYKYWKSYGIFPFINNNSSMI